MNTYTKAIIGKAALVVVVMAALAAGMFGQKGDSKEVDKARKQAAEATSVLNEMMKKPDDFIPSDLLKDAQAIAVFPGVVKGAFIVGGRGGDGLVVRRTGNGWSMPIFYNIGGASFGPQIGVKETDYIMLFMNDGAVRHLMDDNFEFGGDVSFAAGPIGRTAGAGTDASLHAGILTWSRSKGAFIGASLKGAVITADNERNMAVYGMKAKDLMMSSTPVSTASVPMEVKNFPQTVRSYAGSK